jgi:hypothetical protein
MKLSSSYVLAIVAGASVVNAQASGLGSVKSASEPPGKFDSILAIVPFLFVLYGLGYVFRLSRRNM